MTKRDKVFQKYNGLCAYTGKSLDTTWQIDHLEPVIRKSKIVKGGYFLKETGERIDVRYLTEEEFDFEKLEYRQDKTITDGYVNPDNNCFENLMPSLRIINHYKREKGLEEFRRYITTLNVRLAKLPKNPSADRSIKRKDYLLKVADLFNITPEKPFNGKFYFETLI